MTKKALPIVILLMFLQASGFAQERLAILPFRGVGVEASNQESADLLLRGGIERLNIYELIPLSRVQQALGDRVCAEKTCAAEVASHLDADKVVFGSLNRLGEKIIVQYALLQVSSGRIILSDDADALYIEDLDQILKRVALSIGRQTPFERTAEVGLVTAQESQEAKSRQAQMNGGIAFGYIYPQDGYDGKDRIFAWDFRTVYQLSDFAVTGLLGIRQGLALNIGGLYFFSRRDFSPYVGGGLGFHAVSHESSESRRVDGIELLLSSGIFAFRTYNFHVLLNLEYSLTFNDFDDRALVLTIGIVRPGRKWFGF